MGSNALIRGTGLDRSKDSSSIVTEGRQRSVSQTIRYIDVVVESVNVLMASLFSMEEEAGPSTESEPKEGGWKSEKKGKGITKSPLKGKNEWTKKTDYECQTILRAT